MVPVSILSEADWFFVDRFKDSHQYKSAPSPKHFSLKATTDLVFKVSNMYLYFRGSNLKLEETLEENLDFWDSLNLNV